MTHEMTRDWRKPRIDSLATDALVIRDALEHFEDLKDLLSYGSPTSGAAPPKEKMVEELTALMGRLKSRADDLQTEAERLQKEIETEQKKVGA